MIYSDQIRALSIEMAVIGYILKHSEVGILESLHSSLFATDECRELFDFLKENGVKSKPIIKHLLRNKPRIDKMGNPKKSLEDFVDECLIAAGDLGEDPIDIFIDILEDNEVKRTLCDSCHSVLNNIQDGKTSIEVIKTIDKVSSDIYRKQFYYSFKGGSSKKILDSINDEPLFGVRTGITSFDKVTGGLVKGGIVSIGGVAKNMKTTSTISIMRSTLKANPSMKGIYFQLEMSDSEMALWLIGQLGISRTEFLSGKIPSNKIKELLKENELNNRFDYRTTEKDKITLFQHIERIIIKEKPDLWAIDYMGQLIMNETLASKGDKKYDVVHFSQVINRIKVLCQKTNSICFLIHQANFKMNRTRMDPRPTKEDLEWSSDAVRQSKFLYMCYYPTTYLRRKIKADNSYDNLSRLFFQIWEVIRYSQGTATVLEVEPDTGIFKDPTEQIKTLGWEHWNEMDKKAQGNQYKIY